MPWDGDVWRDPGHFVQVPTADDTSPYSPPEPDPLVPGKFEILHRDVLLSRPRGRGYELRGSVAKLASGELRCRYTTAGVDGARITTYDRWHPDDDPTRIQRPNGRDLVGWLRSKTITGFGGIGDRPDSDPADLVAFKKTYPSVAALLGVDTTPARTTAFEPGKISVRGDLGWVLWYRYLDRHTAGDFGGYGKLSDAPLLSQEDFWTIDAAPPLRQNKAALETHAGCVRSRYLLEPADEARYKRPDRLHFVEFVTVFSRTGTQTIGFVEDYHPSQPPF